MMADGGADDDDKNKGRNRNNNNNIVVVVLSPAKTMDLTPLSSREFEGGDGVVDADAIHRMMSASAEHGGGDGGGARRWCDEERTRTIVNEMKGKTEGELRSLLGLSSALAKTARGYWSEFALLDDDDYEKYCPTAAAKSAAKSNEARGGAGTAAAIIMPAIFTFSGPAFKGLSPSTCDAATLSRLASDLFVLDPVYGALRSLDAMMPYRLEMACRGLSATAKGEKLSSYWMDSVTRYLGAELTKKSDPTTGGDDDHERGGGRMLVNLASEEYSSSISPSGLPRDTIFLDVVFRQKGRVVSVHAKRARGLMARYIAETGATTLEDVAKFDREGYEIVVRADDSDDGDDDDDDDDDDDGKCYELRKTVGENVRILRMVFDREDAPPPSKGATARKKRAGPKKGVSVNKRSKKKT